MVALQLWNLLPWYKRLFKKFSEFSAEVTRNVVGDGLSFAPYNVGDKIGQLVFEKFPEVEIEFLQSKDELSKTERGEGGFGSTGK
jgi:dUTPase